MDCRRRSAVDDVRSRRWVADDDRYSWEVDEDRRRRRSAIKEDRRRRRRAVDEDRRRRRWEVDDYPPLELPLKWRDPPPEYPPLELPLKWRNPLPDHLIRSQPATFVRSSPPLRSHSVAHDYASASYRDLRVCTRLSSLERPAPATASGVHSGLDPIRSSSRRPDIDSVPDLNPPRDIKLVRLARSPHNLPALADDSSPPDRTVRSLQLVPPPESSPSTVDSDLLPLRSSDPRPAPESVWTAHPLPPALSSHEEPIVRPLQLIRSSASHSEDITFYWIGSDTQQEEEELLIPIKHTVQITIPISPKSAPNQLKKSSRNHTPHQFWGHGDNEEDEPSRPPKLVVTEQCLWRPQCGLLDRSVSTLRSWLFENFLHPYLNDVDKHILARQIGISRSQVSNRFINTMAAVHSLLQAAIEFSSRGDGRNRDINLFVHRSLIRLCAPLESVIHEELSAKQPSTYGWFWSHQHPMVVTTFVNIFKKNPCLTAATTLCLSDIVKKINEKLNCNVSKLETLPQNLVTVISKTMGAAFLLEVCNDLHAFNIAEINTNDMVVCGKTSRSGTWGVLTAGVKMSNLNCTDKTDPAQCSQAARQNVVARSDSKFVKPCEEVVQKLDKVPAEVFLTPKHLAIVMEYASGDELFEMICNAGRFSEDEAKFFHQLISGVSYCRSMQICHGDLKLENTLLDGSSVPRLKTYDFGYSKFFVLHSHTKSTVGTPAYIAPEVLCWKEYDGKVAYVWPCGGCTIEWQGLSGNNLKIGTTLLDAIKAIVEPSTEVVFFENRDAYFIQDNEFIYPIVLIGILTPYLNGFVSKLLVFHQIGKHMVQGIALTVLASLADSPREQFQNYYDAVMPYLRVIVPNAMEKRAWHISTGMEEDNFLSSVLVTWAHLKELVDMHQRPKIFDPGGSLSPSGRRLDRVKAFCR